ncbi:MAG: hypothetical protein V9G20_18395 [Candidatus Promineifilaceae bacterium]
MTTPSFIGDWRVSEYLYTPAGEWAGVIHQRRLLRPQNDFIRVIQQCEPVQEVAHLSAEGQAVVALMNRRVGEFVFDLQVRGRGRHYLGPDVVGGGFAWGEGILTARGMWPNFGYNFTSFSILLHPTRQITGGKFFTANTEQATLVGLAVPATEDWPVFAGEPAPHYQGEKWHIAPDGTLLATEPYQTSDPVWPLVAGVSGNEKRYGAMREFVGAAADGNTFSALAVTDHTTQNLVALCHTYRDETLQQVEFYRLKGQ